MTNRQKGDRFERRVQKFLVSKGFKCYRNSASVFPDLIAFNESGVFFVECKCNKYISKSEKEEFSVLQSFGKCFIAHNFKGKILFCDKYYKDVTSLFYR
jgi:Holliday junction resolvase